MRDKKYLKKNNFFYFMSYFGAVVDGLSLEHKERAVDIDERKLQQHDLKGE